METKVAFLIHSLEVNGCRYRVLQYVPYLREHGLDVSVHLYKRPWLDKTSFFKALNQYDILYIHRKLFLPTEFWYIRKKAKRVVYDFDDAVMYRSSSSKTAYSFSRRLKFAYMMKRIDFAVAGNQFLKSEVLPYNPNAEIVPTTIDLSRYTLKEELRPEGPITIGWMGGGSTLKYLRLLIPPLERAYQKFPKFRLKIVCSDFLDFPTVPVVKKQWSAEEEVADLKSFDIGIMPLADDLWSRGKCGLKILQYYGVGVPVVCTPVGVNREMVEDGVSGFWAEDEDQWEDRLLRLMKEERLRKEMGRKGRKRVEQAYTLEGNAPRILAILKSVSAPEKRST